MSEKEGKKVPFVPPLKIDKPISIPPLKIDKSSKESVRVKPAPLKKSHFNSIKPSTLKMFGGPSEPAEPKKPKDK